MQTFSTVQRILEHLKQRRVSKSVKIWCKQIINISRNIKMSHYMIITAPKEVKRRMIIDHSGFSPNYHQLSYAWSNGKNYQGLSWRIWTSSKWTIVDDSRWSNESVCLMDYHTCFCSSKICANYGLVYWQRLNLGRNSNRYKMYVFQQYQEYQERLLAHKY